MKFSNLCGEAETRKSLIVVYGLAGVGKSTFAAQFPGVSFLDTEHGLHSVRGPNGRRPNGMRIDTYERLRQMVDFAAEGDPALRSLAVDTIDAAEDLKHAELTKSQGKQSVVECCGGYGKGYAVAAAEIGRLVDSLVDLTIDKPGRPGITVVVLAHAQPFKVEDPESGGYTKQGPALHKDAWPVLVERADVVGYAYRPVVVTRGDTNQVSGYGSEGGEVKLRLRDSASAYAKNRYGLPYEIPFTFAAFAAAMAEAQKESK